MSKWTEIRDNMGDALQVKQVTESLKQRVSATIVSDVLPHIEDAVNRFTATIQAQAKEEHGWCYCPAERDAGRGVAGQAGADEDAADGTGVAEGRS